MRKCHAGKREQKVGASAPAGRQTVVAANQKEQVAALHFGAAEQLREGWRIHRFAGRVEKNLTGGGMFGPEIGAIRADFLHACGTVSGGAAQEIFGYGIGVRIFRLADEVEINFHSGGISICRAPRHRRSSP